MFKFFDYVIAFGLVYICFTLFTGHYEKTRTIATSGSDANWVFNYNYKGKKLTVSQAHKDKYEAMKIAANQCFVTYTKSLPKFNEEASLEIIDVCANPNSTQQKDWYK